MAEWTMATVLKTVVGASSPGVRIPLPPLKKWDADKRRFVVIYVTFTIQDRPFRGDARVVDWGRLLSG
jgi:hypothetical protein